MRAAVVGMTLVAVLGFASDRSYGQPNPFQQQQPPRTLDNLLGEPAEKAPLAPPAKEAVASVDLLAVPPEAEVAEAIILIRDAYADEYKGEPGALITTLKSAAFQTDDAVRKFALLQEAEKAAVKAGDPSKAFELLEKRGGLFEIDVQQSSIALLKKFPKLPGQTTKKLIEISLQISRTALGADQFPAAKDAVEVAVGKARDLSQEERDKKIKGLGGEALRNEATALQKDITLRSKIFGEYQEAVATLKKAGAGACEREHGVAGRYLCFSKDDWDAGVASLAEGEAGPLQVAASKELMQKSGGQNLPKELLAVAGEWWNLSEKPTVAKPPLSESDLEKIREHWGSLYAEALPHLIDPIDRALANKRSTKPKKIFGLSELWANCDDQCELRRDDGELLLIAGGEERHILINKPLRRGDVITAKVVDQGGERFGFACIIKINGEFIGSSPATWHSYVPMNAAVWWINPRFKKQASIANNQEWKVNVERASGSNCTAVWGDRQVSFLMFTVP